MTHAMTSLLGYLHLCFASFLHFTSSYSLTGHSGLDSEHKVYEQTTHSSLHLALKQLNHVYHLQASFYIYYKEWLT